MPIYIGTNYHPHDHEKWEWERDIALMKEAGFTTVRLARHEAFFSRRDGNFYNKAENVVEKAAPQISHSSNYYAEKENYGFDYLKYAAGSVDYPGMGLYPEYEQGNRDKLKSLCMFICRGLRNLADPCGVWSSRQEAKE